MWSLAVRNRGSRTMALYPQVIPGSKELNQSQDVKQGMHHYYDPKVAARPQINRPYDDPTERRIDYIRGAQRCVGDAEEEAACDCRKIRTCCATSERLV